MIRGLFKILFVVVIGVLVYNYFLGSPEEKENAKEIFGEVKDVVVGVKDLVKSEKEKFDAGKYDDAVDKVGTLLSKLKSKAKNFDEKYLKRIVDLEKKKEDLKSALTDYNVEDGRLDGSEKKEKKDSTQLKTDLDDLLKDTEKLIEDMELDYS